MECLQDTGLSGRCQSPNVGSTDQNRLGSQRKSLDHIDTSAAHEQDHTDRVKELEGYRGFSLPAKRHPRHEALAEHEEKL